MAYEIYFLSVGNSNGDAIYVRHGSEWAGYQIQVTDGGYAGTGQYMIDHIEQFCGNPTYIDTVTLSHQDADHVSGLIEVMKHFDVGALYMNRPWLYSSEIIKSFHGNYTEAGLTKAIRDAYPLLVELEAIALSKGTPVYEAFTYTTIGRFTVLAPSRERYLQLIPQFDRTPVSYSKPVKGILAKLYEVAKSIQSFFETWQTEALQENPSATSPANESCVVQIANFDGKLAVLTADAGPVALKEAADIAATLGLLASPAFFQVPHHGSRRNVTPSVLDRWLGSIQNNEGANPRGLAFCSVGANKLEYPRKRVSNAFLRRGYPIYKTEGSENYIRHASSDMPQPDGMVSIAPIAFAESYEE